MPSLSTRHLAFRWPHAPHPVLQGLDLHLSAGWTGLVGANGAGKTTLLRLLAGELRPTGGRVEAPAPMHLCPQEVAALDPAIQAFAWGQTGTEPWAWQARLRLDPADLSRWPTLSPGERKRWQVGAALASGARTLLLDEPGNHLDGPGRQVLLQALSAFDGVGVLVSHDRGLLDALCGATVELAPGGRVRRYPGPCTAARAAWAAEDEAARREADRRGAAARAAGRALQRARQDARRADQRRSSRSRVKGPADHDGRSMAAKFRAEQGAAHAGRQAHLARRLAEQAEQAARAASPGDRGVGRSLFLDHEPAPRELLLSRAGAPLVVAGRTLLRDPHLALRRGEHLHLAGENGAGKTTLLRALLQDAALPADKVLHLPQDLDEARIAADLDLLRASPPDERGRVLQLVAALGVAPDDLLATDHPSPGQARKLALALGMGRRAWLLALDEPTNHLDLPSIERLGEALRAWPGALLLVTHDDALAQATCDEHWELAGGRLSPRRPR